MTRGAPSKGASRTKAIQVLRARIAERLDTKTLWETIWETAHQSNDRVIALVFGSIIEQSLEIAIVTHFVSMDEKEIARFFGPPEEAPITFDVKIRLSYALGICGANSRDDLTCIRHIRNVFAHTKTELTFQSTEIIKICDELRCLEVIPWGGLLGDRPSAARDKFIKSVAHYFMYFAFIINPDAPLRYSELPFPEFYS